MLAQGDRTSRVFRSLPLVLAVCGALRVEAAEPLDLVPASAMLCWVGQPLPDTSPSDSAPSTLATLVDLGARLAGQSLSRQAQIGMRLVDVFGLMIRFPHALALIDARAMPIDRDPTERKLDQLRFALIVKTAGRSEPLRKIIQKVVNEQTDAQAATLQQKHAARWSYQELRDRRLPDWCLIGWGELDEHFIITIGADVWPMVAAVAAGDAPALSREKWTAQARAGRPAALIEIIVAVQTIRERLDPYLDGRASEFFKAWRADDIDHAIWRLGFEGRALYCVAHFVKDGRAVERIFADAKANIPRLMAVIPDTARYAIYRFPMGQMIPRFFAGLVATRSAEAQAEIGRIWARLQDEKGFDAQRDLLDHLGEYWVLHNDPPHPLRLPLAITTLVEIRDEPARVRATIETVCRTFQKAWEQAALDSGIVDTPLSLRRDDDGVWCLQFGPVAGPAWVVTDRFIITCWSPAALRQYLEKIGPAAGKRE